MHDAGRMRGSQRVRDLRRLLQQVAELQAPARAQQIFQRSPGTSSMAM